MVKVFDWLREKGVKKILSIIVIDSTEPSHSDGAIEAALGITPSKMFGIETWDWKKLDINCDVISRCAPNVKEVSLYSSGNNAVLMGWSSGSGLLNKYKFPLLEKVNLIYQEGLEDESKLSSYVDEFRRRVKSLPNTVGKPVTVQAGPDKKEKSFMEGFQQGNSAIKPAERQHKWLDSSDNFRKILHGIDDEATEVRPVKIAIIDNGVDAALSILNGKIANGASFFPNKNINTGNDMDHYYPYYVASNTLNHGSLVATLVCKMCPKVKLYICRLDEKMSRMGESRYLTMESATEAVKWATGQGVDVICMS
ncbi:hypothetical protein M431DRAFT_501633 [Trichoderma harzianum CBS 226.95]|uniref:Peptidase S8/S53 domain-containing protein n=1 Tax=Trichoderma harzianum CBS 226.95 TaxID=983964 RepID=A0A2T3ZSZ6_TRIHA|nr:hypothetical protein M431DRAFT_501633 [Trichoderma harzianum CBS 226.95]PTB47926.1 hypothetical protein M431DRAFT_501633 [Trichoderma harzianum CBS 226.95]